LLLCDKKGINSTGRGHTAALRIEDAVKEQMKVG
jgi:hypothetical protein